MHLTYSLHFFAEILVLGTGARLERIDPSVLALFKRKGIAVEVQDTVKYHQWKCNCLYCMTEKVFFCHVRPKITQTELSQILIVLHFCLFAVLQPNACATFNFLISERRVTAAGLIPPPVSTALDLTRI